FARETGSSAHHDSRPVVQGSDVLVLAVKPQNMPALLADMAPLVTPRHLVISIAAGVTLSQLADGLAPERRLTRVMPNTPCLAGASAAGYAPAATATSADCRLVDRLLGSVGKAFALPEKLLDAV